MAFCHRKTCFSPPLSDCDLCDYEFCGTDLSVCAGCKGVYCQSCLNTHKCSLAAVQRSFIEEQIAR